MKRKTILRTSLLATALLGAGVLAGSIKDISDISNVYGNGEAFLSRDARKQPPVEHQGVYKEWVQYSMFYYGSSSQSHVYAPAFLNYKLNTPKSSGATQEYIVGIIVPKGSSTYDGFDSKQTMEYLKSGGKTEMEMQFLNIDLMPDDGYTPDGIGSTAHEKEGVYTPISVQDPNAKINAIPVDTEEQWHELFDLDAVDLYGSFDAHKFYEGDVPTTYNSWQHFAYSIPVTDEDYDHLYGTIDDSEYGSGEDMPGDPDALYQWWESIDRYIAPAMHVDSNFALKSLSINPDDSSGLQSINLYPWYAYGFHDYTGTFISNPNDNPTRNKQTAERLSERDDSLWLKYPEPTINVLNAKKNDEGTLIIDDGSFADGYTLDIEYAHNVTDEKFTIVHSFDYALYGPGVKGDGREDVLWDHWYVDDSGIYRQFRTNPEDPDELSEVITIAENGVDTNPWLDGKNEIGEEFITTNPDILDDVDEKDAKGDINIGLVDPVYFSPADPNFAEGDPDYGHNNGETYSTGFLYSESPYNAEIKVDGISTALGSNNSFQWPTKKMNLEIGVKTDKYEPAKPAITKFDLVTDPLHNEAGEIKNSWSYSMNAKTDAEFDGTSYYPSNIEYVQLVSPDGATVYSDMIATTAYEETGDGQVDGTFESGNLPANQTDLPIAMKVYYGNGVGSEPETAADGNKYWTTIYETPVNVNTGVRGSADYTSTMNLESQTSTSATLTLSTTPVQTVGTEDSTTLWGEGLETYETSNIKSGTISVISETPDDITDEDQTTWDEGVTWTNNTSWDLTPTQITELNTSGSTTVVLDGILPNQNYTVKADMVYEGETKPTDIIGLDERWDSTWENDRSFSSNEVEIHTDDYLPAKPENIELSFDISDVNADTRNFSYKYTISMDVSGNENNSDIYAPTNVSQVEFISTIHEDSVIVTEESAAANSIQQVWDYSEEDETLLVSYYSNSRPAEKISDTVTAIITYDGGQVTTFDGKGDQPNLEASFSIPDRGNLEVKTSIPVEKSSTSDSITFAGTIEEIIPVGADKGADLHPEQFTNNTGFSIDIVDEKGNTLATTTVINEVTTKAGENAGQTVKTYEYEVTATDLKPNKQYNVESVITYHGTSKINDEGYLAGEYPDVNKEVVLHSGFDENHDTTDTLGLKDPQLLSKSEVNVVLNEETRDLTASGQFKIGVVSQDESNGFTSDYSPSNVTEIRVMDGTKAVFTLTDESIINAKSNNEIVVDWTMNSSDIEAKTDYDLAVEVDWAGGTKTFDAQHIKFNSGSRGDLEYYKPTIEEVDTSAGPTLTMEYFIPYEDTKGYEYDDFNLLSIKDVQVKSKYSQDKNFDSDGNIKNPELWEKTENPLFESSDYTYDGKPKEFTLGYTELIEGLPRYPGAPEPGSEGALANDNNGNGIYDEAYIYDFYVSIEAEFDGADSSTSTEFSDYYRYDQFSFLKGGFTPVFRDFELSEIEIQEKEDGPTGSVNGSFWIEHRDEGFYDGMEGDAYKYYSELDMWESGIESVKLLNVTDPDRTDFTTPDPLDQVIWSGEGGTPAFFDQPDSFDITPQTDETGNEIRDDYDAWLASEHDKAEFTIEGLTPGQTYKFKLSTHFSGDNIAKSHTEGIVEDGVVDPEGYDQSIDFEIDVPLAGVEQIVEEDVQYGTAKSSLTSWTLSYQVENLNLDPKFENYVFKEIELVDENNEVLASSTEASGELIAENLMPGTDPTNSGWSIIISTEDEQELNIALDEEWLENTLTMDGKPIYVDNGDGTRNWVDSELDAIETWDVTKPELGFVSIAGEAQNVTQTGFELLLDISEEFAYLINEGYVNYESIQVVDKATGEVLNSSFSQSETVVNSRAIEDFAGVRTVYVTDLLAETTYGVEGFDIIFNVNDKYAPNPTEEGIPVTFGTTDSMEITTLPEPDEDSPIVAIVVTFSILIPVILIVLFILWFIMLAWRKEKETEFKPSEVTFRLNRNFDKDSEKLNGAKLQSANGALTHSIKKDIESGKILVTVSNITSKDPIKGLKFIVDNSTVKASNAKVEASNKELETKYAADVKAFEATLKAWEDNKAKATEAGKEFTEAKPTAPAKPSLAKLAKPNKDIKIVGSVKVEAPAPKEPKPAKEVKPTEAKKPAAPKTDAAKQPAVKKPTESKEQNSNDEDDKKSATGSAEIIY